MNFAMDHFPPFFGKYLTAGIVAIRAHADHLSANRKARIRVMRSPTHKKHIRMFKPLGTRESIFVVHVYEVLATCDGQKAQ